MKLVEGAAGSHICSCFAGVINYTESTRSRVAFKELRHGLPVVRQQTQTLNAKLHKLNIRHGDPGSRASR